jgi:hypothetical protein
MLGVTSNWRKLRRNAMEALRSSETSVLKRATRRNLPEDGILYSHRHGNINSYKIIMWYFFSEITNKVPIGIPGLWGFNLIDAENICKKY